MGYPNFPDKHGHDALAEPSALLSYWEGHGLLPADRTVPGGLLMLYQRPLFAAVLKGLAGPVTPYAPAARPSAFLDLHTFDDTAGTVGVVGGFGIGAPAAVSILEMLTAVGIRRFVGVGTAGALRPDLGTGAVVVCDRAVRDEGVSHHYLPPARWSEPSATLSGRLRACLDEAGCSPVTGSAWTIDAPFRETIAEARHYADEGVAVVDMEAAALFAVAAVRGVDVASAFAVSDSLANGEWTPQFGHPQVATSLACMVPAAIAALRG